MQPPFNYACCRTIPTLSNTCAKIGPAIMRGFSAHCHDTDLPWFGKEGICEIG